MYDDILAFSKVFVKSADDDDVTKPPGQINYDEQRFDTPQYLKDIAEQKFSFESLNEIEDYDLAFEYIKQTLKPIGSGRGDGIGSGRIAFDLGDKVLKWAHNDGGIAQNYMESRIQDQSPLLTNVYNAHPKSWWIVSEKVVPFNGWNDFITITGVPQELFDTSSEQFAFRGSLSPEEIDQLRIRYDLEPDTLEFINQLMMMRNSLQLAGDTFVPEHWGQNPAGEIKLYDYGYDKGTFDKVYKGYTDPEASESELEALREMEGSDFSEDGVYLFANSIVNKYIVTAEYGPGPSLDWVISLGHFLERRIYDICSNPSNFTFKCNKIDVDIKNVNAPESGKPILIEISGLTLSEANSRHVLDTNIIPELLKEWDSKHSGHQIGSSFVTKVY